MRRRFRRDFYYSIATLAVLIGFLGSLCAWESGTISLWRMLAQAGFSLLFANSAVVSAKLST